MARAAVCLGSDDGSLLGWSTARRQIWFSVLHQAFLVEGEFPYLLDEPEAALSVHGCLALLARVTELTEAGAQFIVATHSPVFLACPGAHIYETSEDGISEVDYDEVGPVQLTRGFLAEAHRSVAAAANAVCSASRCPP